MSGFFHFNCLLSPPLYIPSMQISRSEQKRRIKEIEQLVGELSQLPVSELNKCPCSDEIRTLLKETATLKGGARKRQLKYVTKLLKENPLEELYQFLAKRKGRALVQKKQFHEVEYLRDALLNEALEEQQRCQQEEEAWSELWKSRVVEDIMQQYPKVEKNTLLRSSFLFTQTRNPRHSREIFRYIMAQVEQQRFENS